jgi:TRAP-type C4-dicarboxylate transport system permease small subunit
MVLLFCVVVFYLGDGQLELQDKKNLAAFRIHKDFSFFCLYLGFCLAFIRTLQFTAQKLALP